MARGKENPPPPLHELESLVMEEVWRNDESTVREVLTALNDGGEKTRAYTTVMTIMARLDTQGLLTRERRGKTDVYTPLMSRDQYLSALAEGEVRALGGEFGDLALAQFAEQVGKLDAKRLDGLRKLAERD